MQWETRIRRLLRLGWVVPVLEAVNGSECEPKVSAHMKMDGETDLYNTRST